MISYFSGLGPRWCYPCIAYLPHCCCGWKIVVLIFVVHPITITEIGCSLKMKIAMCFNHSSNIAGEGEGAGVGAGVGARGSGWQSMRLLFHCSKSLAWMASRDSSGSLEAMHARELEQWNGN